MYLRNVLYHTKKCGPRSAVGNVSGYRCVAQSVTCLDTDACLTADPGVASSIPGTVPYFRGD